MSVNDASMIIIDNYRVALQIVASLTDDSRGSIYDHNMFIVQATGSMVVKHSTHNPWIKVLKSATGSGREKWQNDKRHC